MIERAWRARASERASERAREMHNDTNLGSGIIKTENDKDIFQSTTINVESAVRRSKRVNKFILESTNPWGTIREILTDMDLPVPDYLKKDMFRQKVNVNNSSRLLYESLTAEELEEIRSKSEVDGAIYDYIRDYRDS